MRAPLRILICGTFLLGCSSGAPGGGAVTPGGSGGSTVGTGGAPPAGGGTGGVTASGGSGGSGGTSDGGSGGAPPAPPADASAGAPGGDAGAPPVIAGNAPYGCAGCKKIFDGTTLNGWDTAPGAWVAKDGVLASTGKQADIYTHEDYGDYRIFFQVRQVKGNHKPCTVMFGKRPGNPTAAARSLGGAQFQPPNGGSWDYGIGGTFNRPMNPMFNANNWHQCEVLVKEAGSFRAACCPVVEGGAPCKGVLVLTWQGKGNKHPFDIMMHNGGLFDEYKEIWLEQSPAEDALLSMK
jgi:hypothetical protein